MCLPLQAVVFCNRKPAAEWLARRLTAAGCPSAHLSSDLPQTEVSKGPCDRCAHSEKQVFPGQVRTGWKRVSYGWTRNRKTRFPEWPGQQAVHTVPVACGRRSAGRQAAHHGTPRHACAAVLSCLGVTVLFSRPCPVLPGVTVLLSCCCHVPLLSYPAWRDCGTVLSRPCLAAVLSCSGCSAWQPWRLCAASRCG